MELQKGCRGETLKRKLSQRHGKATSAVRNVRYHHSHRPGFSRWLMNSEPLEGQGAGSPSPAPRTPAAAPEGVLGVRVRDSCYSSAAALVAGSKVARAAFVHAGVLAS